MSDGGLITRRELAQRLGKNPRTIAKWLEEGLPVAQRGRGGRPSLFDWEICRAWASSRLQVDDEEEGDLDLNEERARREHFQAKLAEQTYLARKKVLLPADEVARLWRGEVTAVRALILGSYTTHADRVFRAGQRLGVAGVEAELKQLAHEILNELANPDRPLPEPPVDPPTEPAAQAPDAIAEEPAAVVAAKGAKRRRKKAA